MSKSFSGAMRIVLFVTLVLGIGTGSAVGQSIEEGLIGWWQLNPKEVVEKPQEVTQVSIPDRSQFLNNALGTNVILVDHKGCGGAIKFNGESSSVRVPYSQVFDIEQDFSFTTWINPKETSEKQSSIIYTIYSFFKWLFSIFEKAEPGEASALFTKDDGQLAILLWKDRHISVSMEGKEVIRSRGKIKKSDWTYLAAVRNDNEISIYFDGKLDRSTPVQGTMKNREGDLYIGSFSGKSKWFDGSMGDIRFYNRAIDPSMPSQFGWMSWMIIVVYIAFSTWLGHKLSGRQATIKDFFLGGRKMPWYAVSGSIIATELSAMTLVGAPAFLWAATGDMSYAALSLGTILGRIVVGYVFVPRYYEQEIYSPYEYIGNQLGHRANRVTSFLFMIGGIMGQGTRVLLTAIVLQVVTGIEIYTSIWVVGAVAVLWTLMGGITTVIWTDVIQFVVFAFSSILTLVVVGMEFHTVSGQSGIGILVDLANNANKLHILNFELDLKQNYTIWAALVASTIGSLAAYGTDQMMVQRCFCCKGPKEARRALIWSSLSQILVLICLLMGVGLWAYYQKSGLPNTPNAWESFQIDENPNRLVPVFIRFRVHWFFGGLMVAGIFAAAISSLDSILAALAQQTMAWTKKMAGHEHGDRKDVFQSRIYVVVWALILCGMASLFYYMADNATLLIELALSVVGYAWGGILGAFLMALIPSARRDAKGIEYAAALSVLSIFAITRHEGWAFQAMLIASGFIIFFAAVYRMKEDRFIILKLLPFFAINFFLQHFEYTNAAGELVNLTIGWPWYAPLGCLIMVTAAFTICAPLQGDPSQRESAIETTAK